jgi:hypothetical protein
MSQTMRRSAIPRSIQLWESLPINIKESFSRNSFKYRVRRHIGGAPYKFPTCKLMLARSKITLNKARCDLLFKSHFYAHNFTNITDPRCQCGHRSQSTTHVLFHCPLLMAERRDFLNGINSIPNLYPTVLNASNQIERSYMLLHGCPLVTARSGE